MPQDAAYNDLLVAVQDAARNDTRPPGQYALMGYRAPDGSYRLIDPDDSQFVWVRLVDGSARTPARAYNPRVTPAPDLPVRVGPGTYWPLEVLGIDNSTLVVGSSAAPSQVGPHTHNAGALWDPVDPRRIMTGHIQYGGTGLRVTITAYAYMWEGQPRYYPSGQLDMTSYLPSTSGTQRWALIGLDPVTNEPIVAVGAELGALLPMTTDQLTAISFAGYIPLGAVKLSYGQTSLQAESYYVDFSAWRSGAGLDRLTGKKHAVAASTAPAVTDDAGDGYSVGSRWLDTTNQKEYVCLDATASAAVWVETTGGGGGTAAPSVLTWINL